MTDLLPQLQDALRDRYTIEREIGHGGTALVFLAHDRKLQRRVAIKLLRPDLALALGAERFLREIEIVAQLHHPHILQLHDSGATQTLSYYVMPVVEGESLRDRIKREGQLPFEEALRITGQVADALDYAHGHGVVHRDIKPENILLASGEALVADFGIARVIGAAGEQLTETGIAVGTPAYMSPEQATGDTRVDGRTDIYALGCVLYEMLAGQPPFTGSSPQAVIARHAIDPVPALRTIRPDLPVAVDRTVLRALAKAPADRFASPAAFKTALAASTTEGSRRRWTVPITVFALAILVLTIATAAILTHRRPSPSAGARAIAVLPFDNIGGDPNDEYFSDGMSEELIAALSRIPGLRVTPRTSAFSFKHKTATAPEIGRTLHVEWLLHGAVRHNANRFRVTAELIAAVNDSQVWSDEFERDVKDVFAVQDGISRAIVGALQLRLAGASAAPLVRRSTSSPEAHDLYLKGRYFFGQRTGDALRKSVDYFEAAIARDSGYASAYSGLSDAYSILSIFGYLTPVDGFPRSKAAALHAIQLDSTLAEAETSLGIISHWYDWDNAAAQQHLTRAIALDSSYPPAHLFNAWRLAFLGEFNDAVREAEQARALDPLSVIINLRVASILYFARRYDEAIAQAQRTLELDSLFPLTHAELARIFLQQGRCTEALANLRFIPDSLPNSEGYVTGYAYGRCGRRADAVREITNLQARKQRQYVISSKIAIIYMALENREQALAWLDKGIEEREAALRTVAIAPEMDPLRHDPRFAHWLARLRP